MFPADTLANYTGKFCIEKIQVQRKYIKLNVICKIFDETKDFNQDSDVNNLLQHFYTFTIFLPMAGSLEVSKSNVSGERRKSCVCNNLLRFDIYCSWLYLVL